MPGKLCGFLRRAFVGDGGRNPGISKQEVSTRLADPSWPSHRKMLVLAETHALLLLTSRRLLAGLVEIDGQVICMDSEWEQISRNSSALLQR